MPYFNQNDDIDGSVSAYEAPDEQSVYEYDGYDDGFDELQDEPEPEISDDEIVGRKNNRIRLMFDVGNLTAIITGTILILIMVSLLVSMIHFLVNDINQNFSLLQTRF